MTAARDDRLAELADRLAISDLLHDFARRLDAKDWAGYAANYAGDGVLELPWATVPKAELAARASSDLGRFHATQHYSSNHAIEVDGDTARSRSYLVAIHVFDGADPSRHADVGGWYDCELRRTGQGWKFTRVRLNVVWAAGEPMGL